MAKKAQSQTITIHAQAPHKPALGAACNGCGVCCAAEPCPVSLALLWPHEAPCRALIWSDQTQRYLCGMVSEPARFLWWLPENMNASASRLFKRWIAAGTACDADVSLSE
ncbi:MULTISPECIES: hypothetical protein [unclassified Methylophilus]|uniref:hypothetical protein n=1 Tax=unclassified Methylophilus TaxID=2630143 RepID=UPI00037A0794|nr:MULTISPECIES: hypothetical protein [unclassified Methylophilus]